MLRPTAIERAFALAASGRITNIKDLRHVLKAEGITDEQLYGRFLREQLQKLMVKAQGHPNSNLVPTEQVAKEHVKETVAGTADQH